MTNVTQPKSKQYGRPDNERIIGFMKISKPAAFASILITIASIFFIAFRGLNLGLDFTGGIAAEVTYQQAVDQDQVIKSLESAGFEHAVVQTLGSNKDLLIRMPVQKVKVDDLSNTLAKAVQVPNNTATLHKVDSVGGQVGNELYVRSGGGVVFDSVPETEYAETMNKAKAMIEAIEKAQEVDG